jgi:excinuclease ABC subunit C
VEVLNRHFQLRDCSSKQKCSFTEQLQLFELEMRPGCIRLELESCLGPCIAACSRQQYERQVMAARTFLEGKCNQPVEQLTEKIRTAALNLHFERAAVLREDWRSVQWLARRAEDLAQARTNYTFVYPVRSEAAGRCDRVPGTRQAAAGQSEIWYLIRHGVVEAAVAAPTSAVDKRRLQQRLAEWLGEGRQVGSAFHPRPETLALVTGWFRRHRGELKKTFLPTFSNSAKASKKTKRTVKV